MGNATTVTFLTCIGFFLVLFAIMLFAMAIKIVREYQRLVVFRLGKCVGQRGPGLVFLIPFIEQANWVDLREQSLEVPQQTTITKDNASISIDFLIFWKVVSAVDSVIAARDFATMSQQIAATTLRAVIGDILLDDVLAQREHINTVLREKLDAVTERWGNKVTAVEIREILPPRDIQEAMTRQMSAERTKRATITEAEGKKQAAITVAEGDKQSAILRAEGEKQARILAAQGYSQALEQIFSAAKGIDAKTMSLQYLDTLKALGASPATKFVFPAEFTNLLKPFIGYAAATSEEKKG